MQIIVSFAIKFYISATSFVCVVPRSTSCIETINQYYLHQTFALYVYPPSKRLSH